MVIRTGNSSVSNRSYQHSSMVKPEVTLAEILTHHSRSVDLYSGERPSLTKGIAYGLPLVGVLALGVYLITRPIVPALLIELGPFFLSLLVTSIIGAIIVTLKVETGPLGWEVGCWGNLFLIAMFPFIVQFYICRLLWFRSSFHLLPSPVSTIAKSRQPFGFYLRSFIDDDKLAKETVDFSDDPFRYARSVGSHITVQDRVERVLGEKLVPHLATLCIGRPGEKYPSSPFLRIFVDNAGWQEVAQTLLQACQLVIAHVGETPGFRWELKAIREARMLKKTVLFFCTTNGLPFTSCQIREVMTVLEINIFDVEVPTETYFCVFDDSEKPAFLPAPLQSYPNSYSRIRNSSKELIRYLSAQNYFVAHTQ